LRGRSAFRPGNAVAVRVADGQVQLVAGAPILVEAKANARWSLDFVHDQFACGRRFRVLNIVDDVTRKCRKRQADPIWRG
jgi:hypothetical protein